METVKKIFAPVIKWWNGFVEKHPKLAEWVREGGLFLVFSYVVTFIKLLLLMFLPALFHAMVGDVEWLWPSIPVTMFGVNFKLAIIGNALETASTGGYLVESGWPSPWPT